MSFTVVYYKGEEVLLSRSFANSNEFFIPRVGEHVTLYNDECLQDVDNLKGGENPIICEKVKVTNIQHEVDIVRNMAKDASEKIIGRYVQFINIFVE